METNNIKETIKNDIIKFSETAKELGVVIRKEYEFTSEIRINVIVIEDGLFYLYASFVNGHAECKPKVDDYTIYALSSDSFVNQWDNMVKEASNFAADLERKRIENTLG